MKVLQTVAEVKEEGLEALLGEKVILLCANYFYLGKLVGINNTCVKLEDPSLIYETGSWANKMYSNVEKMNMLFLYVQLSHIESFGAGK